MRVCDPRNGAEGIPTHGPSRETPILSRLQAQLLPPRLSRRARRAVHPSFDQVAELPGIEPIVDEDGLHRLTFPGRCAQRRPPGVFFGEVARKSAGPAHDRIEAITSTSMARLSGDYALTDAPQSRNSRSPCRAARPHLESLEPRLALSASPRVAVVADTLMVKGTPGPDGIRIEPTRHTGTRRVVFDGKVAQKSLGVIQVGPSVSGTALRALSGVYTRMPLQSRVAGPVIVGAADLRGGGFGGLLKRDYNDGQTVALANATPSSTASLARILDYSGQVKFPDGVHRAELVAFRKVAQGDRTVFSTYILPPTTHVQVPRGDRKEGRQLDAQGVNKYLQQVFAATPAVPAQPQLGGPAQDLLTIANAYAQTIQYNDTSGAQLQLTDTVYDVRSFTNMADYYYVSQELITKAGTDPLASVLLQSQTNLQNPQGTPPVILELSPQSNPQTTTYTSNVGWSISGSIGVSTSSGLNASITAGVSVSNSTTVPVPPISIQNLADPMAGTTKWNYVFNNPPAPGESNTFSDQWIWRVPWTYYQFDTYHELFNVISNSFYATPGDPNYRGTGFSLPVPVPFGKTTELDPPIVNVMNPNSVAVGNTFIINGVNYFPSLVESVLIGGKPLDPANWMALNNQQIQAVAPDTPGKALPVVVKTALGLSNSNATITITGLQRAREPADPGSPVRRFLGESRRPS